MESGQVRSATFLAATADICFIGIVVICAWILIGQHASASGGRVVLGAALVVAILWLKRNGIRRWAQGFRRNHPVSPESSDSRSNSLQRIEGLSAAGIAELNQMGIETVEHLATSDPLLLFQQTSLEVLQVIDCIGQAQLRTRFLSMGRNGLERRLRNSGIRTVLDLAPVIRVPNPPGIFESDDDVIDVSSWDELQHVAMLLEKDPAFKALADLSAAVSERSVSLTDAVRKVPEPLNIIVRDALPTVVRSEPLTAYDGWLAVDATAVRSDSGGGPRRVRVHISTQEIRNLVHRARVTIEDGERRETIRFQVRLDVRRGENRMDLPRSKWVTVPTRDGGEAVDFELDAAPPIETLRAMLLHAGKTVQVLEVELSPAPSLELPWRACL